MLSLARALFVPVLILAFCAIYMYRNRSVPARDMMLVTAVAVLLVLLVLSEMVRSIRADRTPAIPVRELARPLLFLVAIGFFAVGAEYDFIVAGLLLTAVVLVLLGERRPLVVLGNAVVFAVGLFYLFDRVMGVPLTSSLWDALSA